jgi:hypothetical protein
MKINGVDLLEYGVVLTSAQGWRGRPSRARDRAPIAGGAGTVPSTRATQGSRSIRVEGYCGPTQIASLTDRSALLDALEVATAGLLEVEFDDDPGRVFDAECVGLEVRPVNTIYGAPSLLVDLELIADATTKRDATPLPRSFGSTPVAIPTGTAAHGGTLWLYGAATDPVVTCRRADGAVAWELGFTVALTADDFLAIDLLRHTVTLSDNSVTSNGIGLWTSGAWGAFRPEDADPIGGGYPTLEVSAGSGMLLSARRWAG